ncbi:hypothetical protein GCM10018952_08790 [Streptosporangium vulgare]
MSGPESPFAEYARDDLEVTQPGDVPQKDQVSAVDCHINQRNHHVRDRPLRPTDRTGVTRRALSYRQMEERAAAQRETLSGFREPSALTRFCSPPLKLVVRESAL